jgi:hypothetical protein
MDKSTQKRRYGRKYKQEIIKALVSKYGVTADFIRQSLRGDRTSDTSMAICEDYKKMETALNEALANV